MGDSSAQCPNTNIVRGGHVEPWTMSQYGDGSRSGRHDASRSCQRHLSVTGRTCVAFHHLTGARGCRFFGWTACKQGCWASAGMATVQP